ncbi:YopX family protein [Campylobacter jejuni]|uniref:YopX family protein n=1 Tax=Campylobacter jejuni TaxID=197 RepID=UPI00313B6F31
MKLKDFDFRIWSVKKEKYLDELYSNIISLSSDKSIKGYNRHYKILAIEFSPYDSIPLMNDNEECFEIELFTGLYDKNETKIYEGDIVCCSTSQGEPLYYFITTNENINTFQIFVISDLEKLKICNEIDINRFLFCDLSNLEDMKLNSEVVGNIHNIESISKGIK